MPSTPIYEGFLQSSNSQDTNRTWGDKFVENIVQAIARDCLAIEMTRLDDAGFDTPEPKGGGLMSN